MRRFAIALVMLLAITAVAPVMACATGEAMTNGETSCCRAMHGQCGEMAKTGCCETKVRGEDASQVAATPSVNSCCWVGVAHLAADGLPVTAPIGGLTQVPHRYLPPGLPASRVTVLRI